MKTQAHHPFPESTTRFLWNQYSGFRPWRVDSDLQPTDRLIAAWFDGEPELWIVDCPGGIGELRRYYREQFDRTDMEFVQLLLDVQRVVTITEYVAENHDGEVTRVTAFPNLAAASAHLKLCEKEEGYMGGDFGVALDIPFPAKVLRPIVA